jgi:hypothetical protein
MRYLSLLIFLIFFDQEIKASNIFSFLRINSIASYRPYFENPAYNATSKKFELLISHTNWIQDIKLQDILLNIPTDLINISIFLKRLSMSDIEKFSPEEKREGYYSASAGIFSLGFAKEFPILERYLSLGYKTKWIYENIEEESAKGVAFDIGCLVNIEDSELSLGLYNLGSKAGFVKEKDPLPFYIECAIAKPIRNYLVYFKLKALREGNIGLNIGGKGFIKELVDVECNFNLQKDYDFWGEFGFGVKYRDFLMNYLCKLGKRLGTAQLFTLSYQFAKPIIIKPYILRPIEEVIKEEVKEEKKKIIIEEKEERVKEIEEKKKEEVIEEKKEIVIDTQPPYLAITANPGIFSPNIGEYTTFIIICEDDKGIKSWKLLIQDKEDRVIKELSGTGQPPHRLTWDGKDKDNKPLEAGSYKYTMIVEDIGGNITQSQVSYITIFTLGF